ncbi:MAG TPA: RNA chaperone Hfq [Thermoanaerobaculia bacterium]|jgi:sRNA-binding regulator protein Hfq|nr:RNA chaperone Hfq [Thermoanaerobaculia bacterium]HPA53141.1 RNA chaperone Hfq [Thermoanaerobaculia bacterium]HQN08884.1 RNA chaperone Hfq [Thermoanaerobaculia bacterium]HQP88504.1 RNA chaperone Hfq [Thermoanaerobaculia bacterium]
MAAVRKPPSPASPAGARDPESELGPRKLIRPALSDLRRDMGPRGLRKGAPPEQTNAESFYYLKQMQARTPVVVLLVDGEELRGWIEWYDKDAIKLNREHAPNLLLQKHAIKYLYKEEEERPFRRRKVRAEPDGGSREPEGR